MSSINTKLGSVEAQEMQNQLEKSKAEGVEKSFIKKTFNYLFISDYDE